MSEGRTFHKYGECKQGIHNKYYEVEAIELEDGRATWAFRWARIGQICGKPKEGTVSSFQRAKQICKAQWKKKAKYKEVTAMEALASAAQEVEERPNNGLPPIDPSIPCFHAGKSEDRMKEFCRKYVAKLNVIRASRNSLGYDAMEKQVETLLKQYCAEFGRIKGTKAHGTAAKDPASVTAFSVFFRLLKDNAGCSVYGFFPHVGVQ
jgi:hypothetical protein